MSPSRSAEIVRFKTPNFSFPGLFLKKILTPCCKQRWPVTWWQALQYWTRCSREPRGTIRMESHGIKSRKWIPVEWRATKHKNIENIRYWLSQICRCYFDFGLTKKTAEKKAMVPPSLSSETQGKSVGSREKARPSSETQGAVIRVGRKGGTKVFITGERAPGYRLSPDHFQKFKRMPAPDWAQKMLCIIVPNRRTDLNEFFSCVRTRRLLSRSRLV